MLLNKFLFIIFFLSTSFTILWTQSYERLKSIYNDYSLELSLLDSNKIIEEEENLVLWGHDIYKRKIFISHRSRPYLFSLDSAAKSNDITLLIISGYRSYLKQAQIINNKLESGKPLSQILKENELPGYSQHHTGSAIDICTENDNTLAINFQYSREYKWLIKNAHLYNYYLSYSDTTTSNINFEPWHWYYKEKN